MAQRRVERFDGRLPSLLGKAAGETLERFVRPRESARGRTNRASRHAQLAVRARAARPNVEISRSVSDQLY